jgi:anti-sigma B factor antagonist
MPPVPPEFTCDLRPERSAVVVIPHGEVDLATVPVVEAHLRELDAAGFEHLVVDLRQVELLSSTGVEVLLRWTRETRRAGKRLSVIPGPPRIQHVLELTGADVLLDAVDELHLTG